MEKDTQKVLETFQYRHTQHSICCDFSVDLQPCSDTHFIFLQSKSFSWGYELSWSIY